MAGADEAEKPASGEWGTFTLKEVVPVVSILATLLIVLMSFNPFELRGSTKLTSTLPLTGAPPSVRKSIEHVLPNVANRERESQQTLVLSAALVVPLLVSSLIST